MVRGRSKNKILNRSRSKSRNRSRSKSKNRSGKSKNRSGINKSLNKRIRRSPKYERCVRSIKAKQPRSCKKSNYKKSKRCPVNPFAVCYSSLRRKYS